MIRRVLSAAAVLLACLLPAMPAASSDEDFLAAREAYQRGKADELGGYAAALAQHPLGMYVDYWALRARLDEAAQSDIDAFVARHGESLVSERLRIDWLKELGERRDWPALLRELPRAGSEDIELTCYALQARRATGDAAAQADARALWFQGTNQPDSCAPVFDAMLAAKELSEDDVWARVRMALENGNLTLAKALQAFVPSARRIDNRQLDQVVRNPQRHLDAKKLPLRTRGQREVALFAVLRLAQSLPTGAAARLERVESQLSTEDRGYAWLQVALAGALRHRDEALGWFKRGGSGASDRQLGWMARAAMRQGDWASVNSAIDAMSERERGVTVWRYWKGRALREQGRHAEGNVLLAALSVEHNFYAQLAAEDLGPAISALPAVYPVTPEDIAAVERIPAIQRALKYHQLGMRYEGALEWRWAIRSFDDRKLLAAAEVARRAGWLDRAIDSADRTESQHDFGLRYPMPYRDVVGSYSRQLQLDEAWVYGLVRQESRFVVDARSSAGASGLMQLMPATARAMARRLGLSSPREEITTIDTNITLGTHYLRNLLDSLDQHPVLATAGYNAGPGRARAWRANKPLEGVIYTETIPFNETRDYVRKVMSNTMYYSRLIGQQFVSLKQRLGTIGARAASGE